MPGDRHPLIILVRCLKLRCPVCGRSSIVERPFRIKQQCPSCGALFKREDGFFVGAISVNVVTTELFILALYLISMPVISSRFDLVLTILFAAALLFPIAFYHHSWSLWLSLDHLVESLPIDAAKRPGQIESRGEGGDADR
jgi:uncharacterized protein (DUF983 family)